jgi:hypothetical protein
MGNAVEQLLDLLGVVKGFGISCLKKYGIVAVLQEGLLDRLATTVCSVCVARGLILHVLFNLDNVAFTWKYFILYILHFRHSIVILV